MEPSSLSFLTLVLTVFFGVSIFILARYLKAPAILPLLLGGILLGPEVLGIINPASLGDGIRSIISACVAVILFEGGLTLQPEGMKSTPRIIRRLLTLGVLITWLGSSALVYFLLEFNIPMSLLAGSLIIVTGPTVIAPLLKRIQIKEKLYNILHWEGVLIDPIGVFIAILCFEWISIEGDLTKHIFQLSYRLVVGSVLGYVGGKLISVLLLKKLIPVEQSNIFVFASALFLFGVSDFIMHESGILTVVIAGLVIGRSDSPDMKRIIQFKSELTEIAISMVFILLAAGLKLDNFLDIGGKMILVLLGLMFLVRPLSILLCSLGLSLPTSEKLFLFWIAPRGVVAGSMASLVGVKLVADGVPNAEFLETFTFSVIIATILLQGGTAGFLARKLKVEASEKKGWLIVGAHSFARSIARFITRTTGGEVIFIDTNTDAVREAQEDGFVAIEGNALNTRLLPQENRGSIGYLLALTDNRQANQLICEKWSEIFDKQNLFRWSSQNPELEEEIEGGGTPIWSGLAGPSQIAYEYKNNELLLEQRVFQGQQPQAAVDGAFLMAEKNGRVIFDAPGPGSNGDSSEGVSMLLLKRATWRLAGLLKRQHILFPESNSYREVLLEIMGTARRLYPFLPEEQLRKDFIEREVSFPTTLAQGVAIPHYHCADLQEPLCFIARVPALEGLQTYDGEPVRLLFTLLSLENQPQLHLKILAEIARIASIPGMIQNLINAGSADEILHFLQEEGES